LAHGVQLTALPEMDCVNPVSQRMGGKTTPLCIADPAPLLSYVLNMIPDDETAATELRNPEI
jgi:hypothetical protein